MFEEFDTKLQADGGAKIKIIGVGGGGNNAVNKMVEDRIKGIEFVVANTDNQVLKESRVSTKLPLGSETTKGLGAGAIPEVGQKAAEESMEAIKEIVKNTDLVFIAAGLGGGTGTGAAPVIAKAAKDSGALVIGIVTTPFNFEGDRRSKNSITGLKQLSKEVDSIIVISNDRLLDELGEIPLIDSFQYSDAVLKQAVRTIADLINDPSIINLDFADIKTVIEGQGPALIGVGKAKGENAAVEAAINAINSPILESSIEGAKNAIVNVAGSTKSLTIAKAKEAVETIKEASSGNINMDIMFGVTTNEDLGEEIVVSVIATGLDTTKTAVDSSLKTREKVSESLDDTDIEKYKEIGNTKEFDSNYFEKQRNEQKNLNNIPEQDDIFAGFSLLDDEDDEDSSIDDLLGGD